MKIKRILKKGFDFLGFNIRRFKYNPKLNNPTSQETVLVIKPSKKGINKLKDNIRNKMDKNKPIEGLIWDMNPILRGWGEHKRISYHTQPIFIKLDHWIYTRMMKWITRHKGSKIKSINRYVISRSRRKWNWGISVKQKIINLGEIPIISPKPLKLDKNPYLLKNEEYYNKRKENIIYMQNFVLVFTWNINIYVQYVMNLYIMEKKWNYIISYLVKKEENIIWIIFNLYIRSVTRK